MPIIHRRALFHVRKISFRSLNVQLYSHRLQQAYGSIRMASTASTKSDWSAKQYSKFLDQRNIPIRDLISKIPLAADEKLNIVDLGCGPGNSTKALMEHFPNAHVTAMDSSPDMVEKAKATLPQIDVVIGDLENYQPPQDTHLMFSNAVFQWLSAETRIKVMKRLLESVKSGSVLAWQVPDNFNEPSHASMREAATTGPWADTLAKHKTALDPFQSPQTIYNQLRPLCLSVDLWRTQYQHVLQDHLAIVEWVKGTGLRPFLDPLRGEMREGYLEAYLKLVTKKYPALEDGKVMLQYPRLFLVAVKA